MQGMVAQALQAQGGEMNPQAGFEQNARMLQPGTTLRGTSADGTPMIVSRGSAGTLDDRTRDDRRDQYRTARRERAGELRSFRQNQNAMRNEAMREAVNNPMSSPFMRALAMNNPDGTARLLQAQGQNQFSQAKLKQDAEAARKQAELDAERLRIAGVTGEAEAKERNAKADVSTAEAGAITTASTPEQIQLQQQISALQSMVAADPGNQELIDRYQRLVGLADESQATAGSYRPLAPPKEAGVTGDVPDTDIDRRLNQLYVNDGLRGDDLKSKLLESGIDEERLRRFARDNPSSFVSRALDITFSLPWNWPSEYDRVNEEAAPMISLEEALSGVQSGGGQLPSPPQNRSMIGDALDAKPRGNFKDLGRPKPRGNFKDLGSSR
jgi:hypothetical protein